MRTDVAASAPLRGGRRHLVLRHRGARRGDRVRGGRGARHGAGGGTPVPLGGRPPTAPTARSGSRHAVCGGHGARPGGRTPRRGPPHRVRRRAVHGGVVPRRGSPHPHLVAHEGPDARRRGAVAPTDGPARRSRHCVAAFPDRRRCPGGAVVRLVGGGAQPSGLCPVRAPPLPQGVRRRGTTRTAAHPFRGRHRGTARVDGLGGGDSDGGGLAGPARRGAPTGTRRRRPAGEPRPGGVRRPVGGGGRRGA